MNSFHFNKHPEVQFGIRQQGIDSIYDNVKLTEVAINHCVLTVLTRRRGSLVVSSVRCPVFRLVIYWDSRRRGLSTSAGWIS